MQAVEKMDLVTLTAMTICISAGMSFIVAYFTKRKWVKLCNVNALCVLDLHKSLKAHQECIEEINRILRTLVTAVGAEESVK